MTGHWIVDFFFFSSSRIILQQNKNCYQRAIANYQWWYKDGFVFN